MISEDQTIISQFGIDLLEEEIDRVIFDTNEFLSDATFIGPHGPFWYILQISMGLATIFTLIMALGIAYKMMIKHEPLDISKLFRVLGIAIVLSWWYPPAYTAIASDASASNTASVLDLAAYIPNALGQYTHALYQVEAQSVEERYQEMQTKLKKRDNYADSVRAMVEVAYEKLVKDKGEANVWKSDDETEQQKLSAMSLIKTTSAAMIIFLDKIVMFIALVLYRIGWWGTIYCQQILLGALTIFGPIQWAFSILPKWEGAWSKWLVRYLTVHLYGAMLYFVGFYVLLLFDIVLSLQIENLDALGHDVETFAAYIKNAFFTAGYLMAASIVACKALSLVPDLASWIIPDGDTSFSARGFGEGVASSMRAPMQQGVGSVAGGPGKAFV